MHSKKVMIFTLGNVTPHSKTKYIFENPEPDPVTNKRSQEFYNAFAKHLNVVAWACSRYGQHTYSPELGQKFGKQLQQRMDQHLDCTIDFSIQMVGHPLIQHKEPFFIVCDYIPYVDLKIMDTESFPYFTRTYQMDQDYLYKEATGIICYSIVQRYFLINWLKLDPCKVTAICSGVNGFVDENFVKIKNKLILWVGSDFNNKGGKEVLEAFDLLYKSDPEYKLVMVGIDQKSVHPAVTIIPFLHGKDLEYLDKLYRDAAVFVMPSFKENMGLVYLEAMAHKTPVIVTSRGGFAEIIRRTKGGVVVAPGNVELLYRAFLEILSEENYAGYCDRAYEFARKNATWDISIERMLNAIKKWLSNTPVPDDYTDYAIEETLLPYPSVVSKGIR